MVASLTETDVLVNSAADALQMTLKREGKGYTGSETRNYSIGGFWHKSNVWAVSSDVVKPGMLTFFVRIRGDLWAYLLSSPSGLWLVLFDGAVAKIKLWATDEVGTGNLKDTLTRLKPAARESYRFSQIDRVWEEADIFQILDVK